ncbi:MAG: alpha/beta fold hydrolase [Rubrivivax sp.]|nr:alpha/beta fold hydrolase [Rubrivivax sp.]
MRKSFVIAFSHANGFPAGTYRRLFDHWRSAGHRVIAVERFGHDPARTVTSNWPHLRDELIALIEQDRAQHGGGPVHLVGHSLGGYLSLLVACRRPDLAAGLVLLDSPVLDGWRAHSVQVMKASGLMKRFSPGRIARKRRWQWPSREAALLHFSSKPAFARWHPEVLSDYITAGMEPDPERGAEPGSQPVRLAFHRDIETRIYDTLPHHLGSVMARHPPRCAAAYLAGTRSAEGRQVGLAATRALVHARAPQAPAHDRLQWIEGSHLFPMERPDETAAAVLSQIAGFAPPQPEPGSTVTSAAISTTISAVTSAAISAVTSTVTRSAPAAPRSHRP